MNSQSLKIWEYAILGLFIYLTLYFGFSSYALENMNEGLYAEIAREMLVTGNYLIPHLNFVPYLEKPPLLYWLIAVNYHIFGVSVFSARLVPITAAALTVLVLFMFAKLLNRGREGWFAAIILTTSIGFMLIARVIIFDMLLALCVTTALCSFYLWYSQGRRYYLWLTYAAVGMAFMTKGLFVMLLVPMITVVFMLLDEAPARQYLRLISPIGILIFLTIVSPWVIAASLKQNDFAWNFFVNEQFMRFLNKRVPHDYHTGPLYFYVLSVLGILFPWTLLLPALLRRSKQYITAVDRSLQRFLWAWFITMFVFFSLSQAKAHYYIILGIPALALLLGMQVFRYVQQNKPKALLSAYIVLVGIAAIIALLLAITLYFPQFAVLVPGFLALPVELAMPIFWTMLLITVYGMIGAIILWARRGSPQLTFLLLASLILPLVAFFLIDKQRLQPERSAVAVANYILQNAPTHPVYLFQDYERFSTILFYLQQRLAIVDSVSKDLYFGATTAEADGWFITSQALLDNAKQKPIYIVVVKKKLPELAAVTNGLTFCPVASSGEVFVMTNSAEDCKRKLAEVPY